MYGVLRTGTVGRTISEKLVELGHDVRMGTRQPDATRAQTELECSTSRSSAEGSARVHAEPPGEASAFAPER
jgi:uncharacterized protein YbjT (DUF2867 family)